MQSQSSHRVEKTWTELYGDVASIQTCTDLGSGSALKRAYITKFPFSISWIKCPKFLSPWRQILQQILDPGVRISKVCRKRKQCVSKNLNYICLARQPEIFLILKRKEEKFMMDCCTLLCVFSILYFRKVSVPILKSHHVMPVQLTTAHNAKLLLNWFLSRYLQEKIG